MSGAEAPCLERETGIEPATNSLEGCDSTTELLPLISRVRVGGEGRVRTSVGRWPADLQSAAIDRSATSPKSSIRPSIGRKVPNPRHCTPIAVTCLVGIPCVLEGPRNRGRWSWRRDLNPRPADYKSAALPD